MRYIVGYSPDQRGTEAISLAAALARTQGAELDLVHVLDNPPPEKAGYPERGVQEILTGNARVWLEQALSIVPKDVVAHTHVRYAESFAEGLIEIAKEVDATLIIIGAAKRGLLKRFTIGAVANALLHISPVPVALVPSEYEAPQSISRITCAAGGRKGAEAVLNVAVDAASRRQVPLRLISLLALDAESGSKEARSLQLDGTRARVEGLLAQAAATAKTDVTAEVAHGATIEDAIGNLQWNDDEVVVIGSSRLAEHNKIFLGSTANKMLRELTVPMVVVPRDYARDL